MSKSVVISDPYPRTLKLIFNKEKFRLFKKKFQIISAPLKNKRAFYEKNISKATFILGQPDLPSTLLQKAKKLKAIFNVEGNFMDNMDYNYCFNNGIHVLATSPVFGKVVAELALGLTLSLARNIHGAHYDFKFAKEKYGGESNLNSFLITNKHFGMIGFGDLARALLPLIQPFSNKIFAYDPWIPDQVIKDSKVIPCSLNTLLKKCDIIYVLATVTSKNVGLINKKNLSTLKKGSCFILMSRAALINFDDFIARLKRGDIYAAIDVFPKEPVNKKDPIRKLNNVLFSAHRAGALDVAFKEMGDIVYQDMCLIMNHLPPRLCKRAERETVKHLRSKPVEIN